MPTAILAAGAADDYIFLIVFFVIVVVGWLIKKFSGEEEATRSHRRSRTSGERRSATGREEYDEVADESARLDEFLSSLREMVAEQPESPAAVEQPSLVREMAVAEEASARGVSDVEEQPAFAPEELEEAPFEPPPPPQPERARGRPGRAVGTGVAGEHLGHVKSSLGHLKTSISAEPEPTARPERTRTAGKRKIALLDPAGLAGLDRADLRRVVLMTEILGRPRGTRPYRGGPRQRGSGSVF